MESLIKDILSYLKNDHTKVEKKEGFMGNYYSNLIDTIYVAENFEDKELPKGAQGTSRQAAKLITACHECIHSMQNKYIHLLNTFFANLSIVLAFVYVFVSIFWICPLWLKITTITSLILSIIFRLILETGAVNGSTKLAQELVDKNIARNIFNEDMEQSIKYMNKHKYLALLQMVLDKIIFLTLVIVLK